MFLRRKENIFSLWEPPFLTPFFCGFLNFWRFSLTPNFQPKTFEPPLRLKFRTPKRKKRRTHKGKERPVKKIPKSPKKSLFLALKRATYRRGLRVHFWNSKDPDPNELYLYFDFVKRNFKKWPIEISGKGIIFTSQWKYSTYVWIRKPLSKNFVIWTLDETPKCVSKRFSHLLVWIRMERAWS